MSFKVTQIGAEKTLGLRQKILRPGQPLSSLEFDRDHTEGAAHFGVFTNNAMIGIATVYLEPRESKPNPYAWRLRGMAIDTDFQSKGLGQTLLEACIDYCKKQNADELWCNARSHATGFYTKNGFQIVGNEFDIKGVGPHFVMTKEILS